MSDFRRVAQKRPDLPTTAIPLHDHTTPITGGALSVSTFGGGSGSGGGGGGGGGSALAVTDGSATVPAVTEVDFTAGATVTDLGGGIAGITITMPSTGITIEDEGTPLATLADTLNFVGAGVTASGTGSTKTITIPGAGASNGVINVMDYGAVEDFSTDNATAFAAAVADMVDGCTLLFPSITGLGYKTSAGITITKKACLITGTGSEYGTRIHITTANTTLLTLAPTWDGTRDQTNLVRSLLLTGPSTSGTPATSGRGVYSASDVHLENVGIAGFYDGLVWGSATFYSRAYGCFITNCSHYGVWFAGTNNCTLDTCRITGDFGGGGLIGPVLFGVVISGSGQGITNRIVNCSIEYFTADGVYVDAAWATEIVGTYFESQQSSSIYSSIHLVNGTSATRIESCSIQGDVPSGIKGIILETCDNTLIADCLFGINGHADITSTAGTTNVLMWNNRNLNSGVWTLPATSYTLDPAHPPLADPTTTEGDMLYRHSGAVARLAVGASGTVLHGGTDPAYSAVVESDLSLSAVTTADVSITKHGFAPVLPNDATKYLDGTGAYTTPATATHFLVISSSHSTPLVFDDIVQTSAGDDFVYTT